MYSAAICAVVKTSELNELAQLTDFTCETSFHYLYHVPSAKVDANLRVLDATVDLLNWAVIEADVIIIAACIPSLRPFAISVGQSVRHGGISSLRKRLGYGSTSDAPLALGQMPAGQDGHAFASKGDTDSYQSQASLARPQGVLQTTDIRLKWERNPTV